MNNKEHACSAVQWGDAGEGERVVQRQSTTDFVLRTSTSGADVAQ
jgi:hypothetical protein